MASAFKLLIFDWDGTLVDSISTIVQAMKDSMLDLGVEIPPEDQIRNIIGLGMREAILELYPKQGQKTEFCEALRDRYRYHYMEKNSTTPPFFPGALDMLKSLHGAGKQLAVATGKSRRGLDDALEKTGIGYLFCAIRCADEIFSKPNPLMLLDLLHTTGIELSDALMIGDSEHDVAMAKNAGMASVAVTYGAQSRAVLNRYHPLHCFDTVANLEHWLKNS